MMTRARGAFLVLCAAALTATACGKPGAVIERGALLVRISAPPEITVDELRMWVYDDGGTLFDGKRIPEMGVLPPAKAGGELGTVLVQPGPARGDLRIHVRGLAAGVRKLDGAARVDLARVVNGSYDLALFAVLPGDADGDGVPDDLDDCPARANPQQGGCPSATADAADDGGTKSDGGGAEAASSGGVTGSAGAGGMGGGAGGAGTGGAINATGGAPGSGGVVATGGRVGSGGAAATGGVTGTGGRVGTGGVTGTGGRASTGGTMGTPDAGMPDAMPRKNLGTACGGAAECVSGFCVDGVCCESACNQDCRVCAPVLGRCTEVSRADDVPQCTGTRTCNAAARCVLQ